MVSLARYVCWGCRTNPMPYSKQPLAMTAAQTACVLTGLRACNMCRTGTPCMNQTYISCKNQTYISCRDHVFFCFFFSSFFSWLFWSEDRPPFSAMSNHLRHCSQVHLPYHLAPLRGHHSTQYQCDLMPLPWLQLVEIIHFSLATHERAMSLHVICIQIQRYCATPLYLGKPLTWRRNDLVVRDRKKPWQPETWQDFRRFSPPGIRAISSTFWSKFTQKTWRKGKNSTGANSKTTMETAPLNCRVLSLSVVECVLTIVLTFFPGFLTCVFVQWNVRCGRKHHKLCQRRLSGPHPKSKHPVFGLPHLHIGCMCLMSCQKAHKTPTHMNCLEGFDRAEVPNRLLWCLYACPDLASVQEQQPNKKKEVKKLQVGDAPEQFNSRYV